MENVKQVAVEKSSEHHYTQYSNNLLGLLNVL